MNQMEEKRSKAMLRGFTANFDCETPGRVGGMMFKSPKGIMRRQAQSMESYLPFYEESHSFILDSVNEEDEDEIREDDDASDESEGEEAKNEEEQKQGSNPSSCLDLQRTALVNMKTKLSTNVKMKESSYLVVNDSNSQYVDFYNVADIDDKSEEEINEEEDEDESIDASISYSFHDSTTKSKRKQIVNMSFKPINDLNKFTNSLKNSVIKDRTMTNNEALNMLNIQNDFDEGEDSHNPSNEHLETQRQSQMGKEDMEKNQVTKQTQVNT